MIGLILIYTIIGLIGSLIVYLGIMGLIWLIMKFFD